MSFQRILWLWFSRSSRYGRLWRVFLSASLLYAAFSTLDLLRLNSYPRQKNDLGVVPFESYLPTTPRMLTFRNPDEVSVYKDKNTGSIYGTGDSQKNETADDRARQEPQLFGKEKKREEDVAEEDKLFDIVVDLSLQRLEKQDGRKEDTNKQNASNQYSSYQKVFGENSFAENMLDPPVAPHALDILRDMVFLPADDHLKGNESYFRAGTEVVNEFPPGFFLIPAPDVCSRGESPSLLVVVPSVVDHADIRGAIRSTWGSLARGKIWPGRKDRLHVKLVFVFGTNNRSNNSQILTDESQRYGDIVQGDFVDSYRNLSIKIAAALQWSATYCPGARHVLKADEDTFINVPLLMDILHQMSSLKIRFVLGHKHYISQPWVPRRGRWAVEKALYPFSSFPAYLFGHSYLISGTAVRDLLAAYKRRPVMPNEDALFTGVLAKTLGVSRIHSGSFAHPVKRDMWNDTWCNLASGLSVSRTYFWSVGSILNMWGDLALKQCRGDRPAADILNEKDLHFNIRKV